MRIPYGYRREGKGWAVDDAAAAVVVRIFTEFTALYHHAGLLEVAKALNVDGIPTAAGGRWFASTVKYILQNECYAGRRAGWPGIVNAELWDEAQRRLQALPMGPTR